jgi:hypothetical protein
MYGMAHAENAVVIRLRAVAVTLRRCHAGRAASSRAGCNLRIIRNPLRLQQPVIDLTPVFATINDINDLARRG